MTFNYDGTNFLEFSTEVRIGDSVFKMIVVFWRKYIMSFLLSKWTYKCLLKTYKIYINYEKY